jgi:membrane-associated phospholipid phosphatase
MLVRSRDALLAAGACLLALGLGWVVTFHVGLGRWLDSAALQGFTDLRRPAIDPAAQALADLGNAVPMALFALALVAWALARGRPRVAAAVPAILLGAEATTQVLKPLLADPRVCSCLGDDRVAAASFPSGHATGVMALALCAVLVAPARRRPVVAAGAAAVVVAVAYSLMTLAWHYPSDVLGGFLVAGTWTLGGVAALRAADARWPARTGREAAVRLGQALAPTALTGLLGAGAVAALVVLRPARAVDFAQTHTTFVVAAAAVAGMAAALVAGLALALASGSARGPTAARRRPGWPRGRG